MLLRIIRLGRDRLIRWSLLLTVLFLASVVLIWSAPAIIGSHLVWPRVVSYWTSDLDAVVTMQGVKLRWLAPVVFRGVSVEDAQGESVASIGAIRTEASLLKLLMASGDFGAIRIERPELHVRLCPGGSNLEDILSEYWTSSESSADISGSIEITDGILTVEDPHRAHVAPAQFDSINAVVKLAGGRTPGGSVDVRSCRAAGSVSEGSVAATLAWQAAGESTDWSAATQIQSLDLSLLQPLMERLELAVDLSGIGSFEAEASFSGATGSATLAVHRAAIGQLRLEAPDYLGQDRLSLERFAAHGTCTVVGNTWQVDAAEVDCDAGRVTLAGKFCWPIAAGDETLRQLVTVANTADLQVAGQIDLAQVAATLPHTLRLRQGSVIETGTLRFLLQNDEQSGARRWTAHLKTSELAARRDDQRFTWKAPLQVTIEASQAGDSWQVANLVCTAPFLSLTGRGTPSDGSFALKCDLQQLSGQLQQLVELGALRGGGTMSARLDWKQDADQRVLVHATCLLEDLDVAHGSRAHWREPRLSLTLAGESKRGDRQEIIVSTAKLELASGSDRLELQLLEPVASPGADSLWVVSCHAGGQWETWCARLFPLLPASIPSRAWTVAGSFDLQMTSRATLQSIEIEQGSLRSASLMVDTPQIRIDEPEIAFDWDGRWDYEAQRLRVAEATFQSAALAFRVSDLRADSDAGARVTGDLTFRADLDRLSKNWRMPARQQDWKLAGSAQGQVSLVQLDDTTRARWTVDLVGLELDHRPISTPAHGVLPAANVANWVTVWREPILKVTGSGQCDLASETILLDRFEMNSADKLQLSLQGSLVEPDGVCRVDLQGQVTYDLAQLLEHWAPEWKNRVRWTGHDTQPFRVRGPLFQPAAARSGTISPPRSDSVTEGMIPPALYGESGISWQSADLFGVSVGAGAVTAKLQAGTIQTGVMELPVSGGVMHIEPTVHLNRQPPALSIAPGRVLSNARITAGMCNQWLKYVAPIAAGAAQAEGEFSVSLAQCTIPLEEPINTRAAGTLHVHGAGIGPSPLAQELIFIANQIRSILRVQQGNFRVLEKTTWLQLPQQQMQFQTVDQRVYHDQLMIQAGEVAIYTSGSVGFDQSLSLVAQIPIQEQWLSDNPRLAPLRGHIVQIPISGPVNNPRVDRRAFERLAADALGKVTGKLLEDELRNGLQRWLGSGG